jgi:PAS domain S-box-containing protein
VAKAMIGRSKSAPWRQERHRLTATVLGVLILLLGLTVMIAWVAQVAPVLFIVPGSPAMAINTALCFCLTGTGLIFSLRTGASARTGAFLLFFLAAVMSGVRLIELTFVGRQPQIIEHFLASVFVDQAFFNRVGGGMALNTAVILFFANLSLALTPPEQKGKARIFEELVGYVVIGLGIAALAGYVMHIEHIYRWGNNIGMAAHTAGGVLLLGSAMLVRSWWLQPGNYGGMPVWLPGAICFIGLMVDLYTPLGVANGMIYVPLILTSLWFSSRTAPFNLAFVCSILILLGLLAIDRHGENYSYEAMNRAITVAMLWLVATFVFLFQRKSDSLDAERIRFDTVTRNTPNAIISMDPKGTISLFNPAAEQMFGYTAEEAAGQNVHLLLPAAYHAGLDDYFQAYLRTSEEQPTGTTTTISGLRRTGETFPLDVSLSAFKTGPVVTFVAILRDISARVAQEEQLRTMFGKLQAYTDDLERSNTDLDEFAYIASHDLKEPLRGMHNHSRFLLEDYEKVLDEDGVRRLNRIVRLSQRMEKLVNDLLYFSRIGRQQLAIKRTDVHAIVKDVVSTMDLYLEERRVQVLIEEPLPDVVCDALRLTEVYRNLITNAVKYNDKAEPVVTIGHLAQLAGENGSATRDVYFVRDNGKGIPLEFHEDIFRIFKRLEKSQETDDGTGAGLTFVRKIIGRHDGDVWLESEIGRGTTFYFTLGHKREDQHAAT